MRFFTLLLVLAFPAQFMAGDDWSRWLGPGENNQVVAAADFQPDFEAWKVAWRAEVGLGYSTVTTSGQRAITLGHDGDKQESVVCLDLETGRRLWEYRYPAELIPIAHPGGPNASATIVGDSLFTVSKDGQLHSLSLEDGTLRWKVNLVDLLGVEIPRWGFACSPLLHGGNLILSAGKLAALDSATGKPLWINKSGWKAGYATPRLFQYEGQDYLAAMDADGISVFKATDGSEVARHRIRGIKHGVTANTPVALEEGRKLLLHTNGGSSLLAFNGSRLKPIWTDRKLQNSLSGFLVRDCVFYGLNGLPENSRTSLFCRQLVDGEVIWSVPGFGYGSLIAVGDTLVILTEDGELVSSQMTTNGYQEISRVKLVDSVCWTAPSYAGGTLLVRNNQGTLICLDPNKGEQLQSGNVPLLD